MQDSHAELVSTSIERLIMMPKQVRHDVDFRFLNAIH